MKKGTIHGNAPTQRILINFDKRGRGGGWDEIQSFRNGTLTYKHRNRKTDQKKTMKSNLATLPATVTLPPEPWEETEKEFGARLKAVASWANHHHDVEGLCKEMPQRMHDFVDHPSKNPRAGPAMA